MYYILSLLYDTCKNYNDINHGNINIKVSFGQLNLCWLFVVGDFEEIDDGDVHNLFWKHAKKQCQFQAFT